jgi:hypothetical protein
MFIKLQLRCHLIAIVLWWFLSYLSSTTVKYTLSLLEALELTIRKLETFI